MKIRALAANLLTLLVASALGLLSLEALARMAAPRASAYTGRGLYLPDDELGHRLRPGVSDDPVRTNSWGFRDREYPERKPAGTFRIVGIGDSFTFGGSDPSLIYLEVLEGLFRSRPLPVDVINTGVPAYSTIQEVAHLRRFGLRFEPDVVVLGLFLTGDVIENNSDEHLQVVDGELTSRPVGRWERLLLRSHLFRFVRSRLVVHADSGLGTARFLETEHNRLQTCRRTPPGHVRRGYAATERLLRELQADLTARRVGLVVLLIPDEFQVAPELFATLLRTYGEEAGAYDLDMPQQRVGAMLAAAGVPVVDVLPECRDRQRAVPVYLHEDTHWNAEGHAIAARALLRRLEALYPQLGGHA